MSGERTLDPAADFGRPLGLVASDSCRHPDGPMALGEQNAAIPVTTASRTGIVVAWEPA